MKNQSPILTILKTLKVSDKHVIADIMASRGYWKSGTSSVNNTYKHLVELSQLGQIEKCNGFFRIKGCESEWCEHAQLLTKDLAKVIIKNPECIIRREITLPVGLRPDALILLRKNNKGFCFVYECINNETLEYLEKKKNIWKTWPDALITLSELFKYKIPHFIFTTDINQILEAL